MCAPPPCAVFAAVLSPYVLHEPTGRGVLLAIPFCLVGVVLVAKPSFLFVSGGISLAGLAVGLNQAFFSASAKMCVRMLSGSKEPMAAIVFSMGGAWWVVGCATGNGQARTAVPCPGALASELRRCEASH